MHISRAGIPTSPYFREGPPVLHFSDLSLGAIDTLDNSLMGGGGGGGGGGSCSVQCGMSNSVSGLYAPDAPITVTTKMSPGIVRYPLESKIALVENHQSSNLTKQVQTPKPTCLNDHLLAGVCIAGPEHLSCPYSWPDDHACPILTTTLFSGMYVGPWLGELEHSFGHNPALFNLLTLFC